MTHNKKDLEAIIDETLNGVRNEHLDPRAVDDTASRVWARIATAQNTSTAADKTTVAAEHINSCADFQSLLPSYLRRELSPARTLLLEDHTQECIPCRKALKEARTGVRTAAARATLQPARSSGSNFTSWRWAVAASIAIASVPASVTR